MKIALPGECDSRSNRIQAVDAGPVLRKGATNSADFDAIRKAVARLSWKNRVDVATMLDVRLVLLPAVRAADIACLWPKTNGVGDSALESRDGVYVSAGFIASGRTKSDGRGEQLAHFRRELPL